MVTPGAAVVVIVVVVKSFSSESKKHLLKMFFMDKLDFKNSLYLKPVLLQILFVMNFMVKIASLFGDWNGLNENPANLNPKKRLPPRNKMSPQKVLKYSQENISFELAGITRFHKHWKLFGYKVCPNPGDSMTTYSPWFRVLLTPHSKGENLAFLSRDFFPPLIWIS